jgi:hypothetical protein
MRKAALYSRSAPRPGSTAAVPAPDAATASTPLPAPSALKQRLQGMFTSPRALWVAIGLLSILLLATMALALRPATRALTQDDINAAVLHTLENTALPSPAARAAAMIRPSVVRVTGYRAGKKG